MTFDKIILKNLLKNFNSVPFTVQFWDDEVSTIGEGDAWIRKYIFPGGTIPSLREIISLSANYNFHAIDEISKKFDERFIRMCRMYLCSCAASFNNGVIDLHQIVFTKGVNNHLPLTRDYLYQK